MQDDFAGKVALVTGAGSGIGRAVARLLARRGAAVVVTDIDEPGAQAVAEELRQGGASALGLGVDVTNSESVKAAVRAAVSAFGGLDLAVNNAGVNQPPALLASLEEADWRAVLEVNLTGVFLCMKQEIPAMISRGAGSIVNIASTLGVIGEVRTAAYTAAKHGVVGLTKAAALEYASKGVRINAVCPGMTETPMAMVLPDATQAHLKSLIAIGRFAKPEEIADFVVFLLSDSASYVTGGAHLVDGGWTAR